ncbi:MAG: hypothetical protein A3G41_06285 [Elusimicrobia bacterium RIFCSPLOWO2_12_FULL_59_9]|nr:MAG: hypothetical protein A3G41_06285 [Elusimicrobia bacterium RIFCSPLOWO2_12_FULL_59_9]
MNFTELADVAPAKIEALKERIGRLQINLGDIQESFTRGGGKGGQKINKTSNCVVLRYVPLALVVKNQRERKRSINRFLALRELVDQIEMRVSPQTSERLGQFMKIRKQKDRRRRKTLKKAGA